MCGNLNVQTNLGRNFEDMTMLSFLSKKVPSFLVKNLKNLVTVQGF